MSCPIFFIILETFMFLIVSELSISFLVARILINQVLLVSENQCNYHAGPT